MMTSALASSKVKMNAVEEIKISETGHDRMKVRSYNQGSKEHA